MESFLFLSASLLLLNQSAFKIDLVYVRTKTCLQLLQFLYPQILLTKFEYFSVLDKIYITEENKISLQT